jgi:hypothetical protein
MINGAHAILYGADAEGTRAAVGPSAGNPIGGRRRRLVHLHPPAGRDRRPPTERRRPGGLYLLCDDVALRPRDRAWPLSAPAPGRVKLGHSICTSVSIKRQCKLA